MLETFAMFSSLSSLCEHRIASKTVVLRSKVKWLAAVVLKVKISRPTVVVVIVK